MRFIICIALLFVSVTAFCQSGTTWYIRADGGTPYTANRVAAGLSAQCDGQGDFSFAQALILQLGASIGGNVPTSNLHCAFSDYRFLYDDQASYGVTKWAIAGGDTVILDPGTQWRVGFDVSAGGDPVWCRGMDGTYACTNPPIPAGTAAQHTQILGRNYANCSNGNVADRTKMSQIFGGHGVYTPMNLASTQYVDLGCVEITRHSQCVVGGQPFPSGIPTCTTADDTDSDGIETDNKTSNLTLTDVWIHGHPGRGVKGPIGGPVTALRTTIGYNESAGWDFDDGYSTPFGDGAVWNFLYSTIEWSGCYQEYPIVHTIPALACYGQSNQGYGDGVGTAPGQELDVYIDHSTFRYNTQDGEDFGHVDGGTHTFSVTNSTSYGNNGAAFKWGWGFTNILFENNIAIANCYRLSAPIGDAPAGFNASLGDFCRSGDALSFNFEDGTQALFANNTIVSYAGVTFDEQCVPIASQGQTSCANAVFNFRNNIALGYRNPVFDYGGNKAPALFCGNGCNNSTLPIGTINRDHNLFWGFRADSTNLQTPGATAGSSTNEIWADPLFVGEPAGFVDETTLDAFNPVPSASSPAVNAGLAVAGLTLDYNGLPWGNPPSIGAVEFAASTAMPAPTPTPIPVMPAPVPSPAPTPVPAPITPPSTLPSVPCASAPTVLSVPGATITVYVCPAK